MKREVKKTLDFDVDTIEEVVLLHGRNHQALTGTAFLGHPIHT